MLLFLSKKTPLTTRLLYATNYCIGRSYQWKQVSKISKIRNAGNFLNVRCFSSESLNGQSFFAIEMYRQSRFSKLWLYNSVNVKLVIMHHILQHTHAHARTHARTHACTHARTRTHTHTRTKHTDLWWLERIFWRKVQLHKKSSTLIW